MSLPYRILPLSSPKFNTRKLPKILSSALASSSIAMGMIGLLSIPAQAADLMYDSTYLNYTLPKTVTETCYSRKDYTCPEITIKYAKSSQDWINNIINNRINQLLPELQTGYGAESKNKPKKMSEGDVKKLLDNFAKSQLKDIDEGSSLNYHFEVEPKYLGHVGSVELFEITSYVYLGGAHGVGYAEYLMFDMDSRQQITLKDVLNSGQQTKFKALAYTEYKAWVKQSDNDIKTFEQNWPFVMTDNAALTDKGITLTYQPYEIAPYAYGMPKLTVPYAKLKGIVKPKYLPQSNK